MKLSEKLINYHVMLVDALYTGPESLEKIKAIAEGCIYSINFRVIGDKFLDKLVPACVESLKMDLKIIAGVMTYDPDEEKESDFNQAKHFLLQNLEGAILVFRQIGY